MGLGIQTNFFARTKLKHCNFVIFCILHARSMCFFRFVFFYPIIYFNYGLSFIKSVWMVRSSPNDYPLGIALIFSVTVGLPHVIVHTLSYLDDLFSVEILIVSFSLSVRSVGYFL